MSRTRDLMAAEEASLHGTGICDNCGDFWKTGPYCPSCGVFALDSHLGRCLDCGHDTEYVNDAWQHVDPNVGCFLIKARGLDQ